MALDRTDTVFHRRGRSIHLTLPDHLVIGRLQDKIGLATVRGPALEAFVQGGIGLHGLRPIVGGGFGLVEFAGQNDLPIAPGTPYSTPGRYETLYAIQVMQGPSLQERGCRPLPVSQCLPYRGW